MQILFFPTQAAVAHTGLLVNISTLTVPGTAVQSTSTPVHVLTEESSPVVSQDSFHQSYINGTSKIRTSSPVGMYYSALSESS